MKQKTNVASGLVFSLFATAACAVPAPIAKREAVVRKAIQSSYNQINAALARKDLNAMWKMMAPDYVGIHRNGERRTSAQQRLTMSRLMTRAKSLKGVSVIQKFRLRGRVATVWIKSTWRVTIPNQRHEDVTTKIVGFDRDTWIEKSGGWLLSKSESLGFTAANGKPVKRR